VARGAGWQGCARGVELGAFSVEVAE
jgi:hypothetical protein